MSAGRVGAWVAHPGLAAAAAILIRAMTAIWRGTLTAPQIFETEELARNLLAGQGYTYHFLGTVYQSFHSMLPYDLLTALVYGLTGGSQTAMLGVQWICAGVLCLLIWRVGRRLEGPVVAALAAWLAALHPGLVVFDATKLQQFSFDAVLVAGSVLTVIRWAERPSIWRAACAGVLVGLFMYERGTLALFVPAAVMWVKWQGRMSWARWARQTAVSLLVAALVVSPWLIRNRLVHQRFIPMMTTSWLALWKGNHPGATGTEYALDHRPIVPDHLPADLRQALEGADELRQMEVFQRAALAFIRDHPAQAVALWWRKCGFFWWKAPSTGLTYPAAWLAVYQAWYLTVVVLCGLVGAVALARGGTRPAWALGQLLLWLGLLFSVGQSVLYSAGRHRWIVEPLLGVLSAAGMGWLWGLIRSLPPLHQPRRSPCAPPRS
jgi:4-amino-4-deoxy-L-arabinose transferase-like glycosyltransferase